MVVENWSINPNAEVLWKVCANYDFRITFELCVMDEYL